MKAYGSWNGGRRTVLGDGRGHEVLVDLPKEEGGTDLGTSALELNLLSLTGCITTILAVVARKRRIQIDSLKVELEGERPPGSSTITKVSGTILIASPSPEADVLTALRITLRTCPVGVLYEKAQIPVEVRPIIDRTPPTLGPAATAASVTPT